MRIISAIAVAAATFFVSSAAGAVTLYSNNFDTENGGAGATALNYNSFNGLTVTQGTVDLVRTPNFGFVCAGGAGSCVDLDGSTGQDGTISTGSYAFNAGDTVTFSFDLSGNQRVGGSDDFQAGFTFGSSTLLTSYFLGGAFGNSTPFSNLVISGVSTSTSTSGNAFQTFVIGFTAGQAGTFSAQLSSINSNDNVGAIADNLNLSSTGAVPEPATWAMMIVGFGAAGSMIRRRRALTA